MNFILQDLALLALLIGAVYWAIILIAFTWWSLNWFRLRFLPHGTKRKPQDLEHEKQSLDETNSVLWIVHGTFARNADWHSLDSNLLQKLRIRFPKAEIRLFKWSGINAFCARRKAGKILLSEIEQEIRGRNRSIQVIGHSHGGTIASWAVSQVLISPLRKELKHRPRVVSLGMPVITGTETTNWTNKTLDLLVSAALLAPLPYLLLLEISHRYGLEVAVLPYFNHPAVTQIAGAPINITLAAISLISIGALLYGVRKLAESQLPKHSDLISSKYFNSEHLKILRVAGDEASSAITALYTANMIIQKIGLLPRKIFSRNGGRSLFGVRNIRTLVFAAWLLISMVIAAMVSISLVSPDASGILVSQLTQNSILAWLSLFGAFVGLWLLDKLRNNAAVSVFQLVLTLVLSPVAVLMHALSGLACGPEASLVGSWRQFTAESSPIGRWEIEVRASTTGSLRHSHDLADVELYAKMDVVESIERGLT